MAVFSKNGFLRFLLLAQGVYYGLTGAWAIVLPKQFAAVTGHGTIDLDTASIAALAFVIGVVFVMASRMPQNHPLTVWLLLGSALAVAVPELFFLSEIKNSLFFYDIFEEAAVAILSLPYFLGTLTPLEIGRGRI